MQILALADRSPATVQFSRLRSLAEKGPSILSRQMLLTSKMSKLWWQTGLNAVGLSGWRSHFRTWSLSDSFPVASGTSSGSPGLWMGCCSLVSFMFSVGITSHQPLSRRGCCKVKSVRDFGDIMDEWSQVEWSLCQKETPFILNRNPSETFKMKPWPIYWTSFKLFMRML